MVNIIKYGGSIEQFYSDSITHIICVSQKHHIVKQVKIILIFYMNIKQLITLFFPYTSGYKRW